MNNMMDVKEAAKYLNANEDTLRGMLQRGEMPGYKIGRLWRLKKEEIDVYLASVRNSRDIR